MAFTQIEIEHDVESQADIENLLEHTDSKQVLNRLSEYTSAVVGGVRNAVVKIAAGDAVKASGTLTFDTLIATDVITINGVDFTCMASGATGNQFNVGGSDTLSAVAAAAAINASATALVSDHVVASAAGDVVTLTAKHPGKHGNLITIDSPDTTVTESGARLTGGAGTYVTHNHGKV